MRPWPPPPPPPPAPALLLGPRAGSCFPGSCREAESSGAHAKVPGLPRGCSAESPGSTATAILTPKLTRVSQDESEPRLGEPARLCREAAGSTAYCEATFMRPSPSRPFPSPPPARSGFLGAYCFNEIFGCCCFGP